MLLVLKWFLSTLKSSYASRSEKLGSEKKPLNPFLGELHLGTWRDGGEIGETQLVSEQVSHHPPVTAYSIWNSTHKVRLQGYNAQKASFDRTINVKQVGHATLSLEGMGEEYFITLPNLYIVGLIGGSPYVELNGSSYIVSSAGYAAKIDYAGKGYFSGTKNSFTATVHPKGKVGSKHDTLYTAEGQWTDSFTIKNPAKEVVMSYTASKEPVSTIEIPEVSAQDPLESRRAWANVAAAIKQGDMDTVAREKSYIEEAQRSLRRKEQRDGKKWERTFFSKVDSLPQAESLVKEVPGGGLEAESTGGIWVWDQAKADKAERPFTGLSRELQEKEGFKGYMNGK